MFAKPENIAQEVMKAVQHDVYLGHRFQNVSLFVITNCSRIRQNLARIVDNPHCPIRKVTWNRLSLQLAKGKGQILFLLHEMNSR